VAEELGWEENMLVELARAVAYPAAPDLRSMVAARMVDPATPAPQRPWRLAAGALAAIVLAVALTLFVSREAREAVADFLGLGVQGERIEVLPTPPAGTTATPLPTPVLLGSIAQKVSREDAIRFSGIQPKLPASLGAPRDYFLVGSDPALFVADYGQLQIWEFSLADEIFIGKGLIGGGDVVQSMMVNGKPGYWIKGGERIVTVMGSDGKERSGTQRTVLEPALVWAEGGLYRRIEGPTTLEAALALAAEMR